MSSCLSRSQGTTLMEVCLAVAIVGVLAMMAIPAFDRARDSYGLTAVADHVRSELHRARILAITRNEDCRRSRDLTSHILGRMPNSRVGPHSVS